MEKEVRQRHQWIQLYYELGDAGLVFRRCGISRPTLRKWWKRYQVQSIDGLKSQSRRPHSSPSGKIGPDHEKLILELRGERVQMSTCKIAPALYQYTAVDDCTRYRVYQKQRGLSAQGHTLGDTEKIVSSFPHPPAILLTR